MRLSRLFIAASTSAVALALAGAPAGAAVSQPVRPGLACVEVHADGTRTAVFTAGAALPQSTDTETAVPIGPQNNFTPGAADRGQPTVFGPDRNEAVRVNYSSETLTWNLTGFAMTVTPLTPGCPTPESASMLAPVASALAVGLLGGGGGWWLRRRRRGGDPVLHRGNTLRLPEPVVA